jgi:hypothetical protein
VAASEYIFGENLQKTLLVVFRSGVGGLWKCENYTKQQLFSICKYLKAPNEMLDYFSCTIPISFSIMKIFVALFASTDHHSSYRMIKNLFFINLNFTESPQRENHGDWFV